MFIVEKDSGETVVCVAEFVRTPWAADPNCIVHNLPKWDWSKADLTGVDTTQPGWMSQVKWNGTTIVKK